MVAVKLEGVELVDLVVEEDIHLMVLLARQERQAKEMLVVISITLLVITVVVAVVVLEVLVKMVLDPQPQAELMVEMV